MTARILNWAAKACLASLLLIQLSATQATAQRPSAPEVWTAIIFDAFQGYAYTWRLKPDGAYEEDGKHIEHGYAIQAMQTGRWRRDGAHMTLRQTGDTFIFDGQVRGERYTGTLYSGGQAISKFCAWKGARIPTDCNEDLSV